MTKETTRPYYSSVSQRDDGLWYFIGRDGQTHGLFTTERNAVKAERAATLYLTNPVATLRF